MISRDDSPAAESFAEPSVLLEEVRLDRCG